MTFDTCIKGRPLRDGTWELKLRITHKRQSRWLPTNITVHADEVTRRGAIKSRAVLDKSEDLLRQVRAAAAKLSPFALEDMDVDAVVRWVTRELRGHGWRLDFIAWARATVAAMDRAQRTKAGYLSAVNSFAAWLGVDAVDINDIRARDIAAWSDSLEPRIVAATYPKGLAYLHKLARKQYNDPDADAPLIPRNPFEFFSKEQRPSQGQHSLGVDGIQALIDAKPASSRERFALDVTLLSFALMGANMADLYELAPPVDGWLSYYRKKTRSRGRRRDAYVRVRVPEQVAPIVARLAAPAGSSAWLCLSRVCTNANVLSGLVNRGLRSWCEHEGVEPFTFYAARHSWATIARNSAGLGSDTADECLAHRARNPLKDIYIERDWEMLNAEAAKVLALFRWPSDD